MKQVVAVEPRDCAVHARRVQSRDMSEPPARMLKPTLIFASVHLLVALGSVLVAFGDSMARFDLEGAEPGAFARLSSFLAQVLVQPLLSLWELLPPEGFVRRRLELPLFALNSLLWGVAAALLWQRFRPALRPSGRSPSDATR